MAHRNKTNQLGHNGMLKKIVKDAEQRGVPKENIETDLKGYKKPSKIENYIPDVKIKDDKGIHITEIETPESLEEDKSQRAAFRRYAGKHPTVTFRTVVVKKKNK